jgi:hypothetical protein
MRYFLLLTFSMFSFADDHSISTDFSDCDGKVVNYYVSKIISGGSVEGMMKASEMHQNFYDEQGANVKVYPALQYLRNDDGTEEKLHRVSTMVVWDSVKASKLYLKKIENLLTNNTMPLLPCITRILKLLLREDGVCFNNMCFFWR